MRKRLLIYKMNKHDIILVNFPFSDLSRTKLRPALIITEPKRENIILCQITTKKRNIEDFEIKLAKKATKGNIKFDSNIYIDLIFTLHKDLVSRKIGHVEEDKVKKEIAKKIKNLFD